MLFLVICNITTKIRNLYCSRQRQSCIGDSSPVTDYRLYDTAYSERFLGMPDQSPAAYDRSAVMTYVEGLKGDLMIYYGTSDDNVHPKNSLQLIRALQTAGKSFEVQVGPDRGHTGMDQTRMMEFFIERLILDRDRYDPSLTSGPGHTGLI